MVLCILESANFLYLPQKICDKLLYLNNKGWKAAPQEPYLALGEFANVVAPFEYLKSNLPSVVAIQMHPSDAIETQRNIRTVKKLYGIDNDAKKQEKAKKVLQTYIAKCSRFNLSYFMLLDEAIEVGGVAGMTKTAEPQRVAAIIKENKDLLQKMKDAEEEAAQRSMNFRFKKGNNNSVMQQQQPDSVLRKGAVSELRNVRHGSNNRLNTPGLQRLVQVGDEDGHFYLKKEIDDSIKRVRAARKGQSVSNVSPQHETQFYMPDQKKYFPQLFEKQESNINTIETVSSLAKTIEASADRLKNASSLLKVNLKNLSVATSKRQQKIAIEDDSFQASSFYQSPLGNKTLPIGIENLQTSPSSPRTTIKLNLLETLSREQQSLQKLKQQQETARKRQNRSVFTHQPITIAQPRIPTRFNELSAHYQAKIEGIIESKVHMKKPKDIQETQQAREVREDAIETLKNFNRNQDKQIGVVQNRKNINLLNSELIQKNLIISKSQIL